MALQLRVNTRNDRLQAVIDDLAASPRLKGFDGTLPADCSAADNGTVCFDITCPATAFNTPASGQATKAGTWEDTNADATGSVDYWRFYKTDGTTCVMQGTITATGGGGDIELDSVNVTLGQSVEITTFTLQDNNA